MIDTPIKEFDMEMARLRRSCRQIKEFDVEIKQFELR